MNWDLWLQVAGIAGTVGGVLVTLTWWLSRQFSAQTEKFFNRMDALFEKVMSKLEYHEQHDDRRFSEIKEDLTELRIRSAYLDAKYGIKEKTDKSN